jgi:hypothetical protein
MMEEYLYASVESSEFDNEEIYSPPSSRGSAEGSRSENSNSHTRYASYGKAKETHQNLE